MMDAVLLALIFLKFFYFFLEFGLYIGQHILLLLCKFGLNGLNLFVLIPFFGLKLFKFFGKAVLLKGALY